MFRNASRVAIFGTGLALGALLVVLFSSGQEPQVPRLQAEPPRVAPEQEEELQAMGPRFPSTLPHIGHTLPVFPPRNKSGTWKESQRVKDMRKYGAVRKIPPEKLASASTEQLDLIYHSFLDNHDIICRRKLRLGHLGDGGWEVCDDIQWRPIAPCIIYSFGINNDFTFDNDASRIYGCEVFSFDPSMTMNSSRRSDRVVFYKVGLGGRSGPVEPDKRGWELHSLANIRQMLNHTKKVIDVLKMDVEKSEWSSLKTMIDEGQLHSVRQLLVEYHSQREIERTREGIRTLSDLEKVGFRKFYANKNFHCRLQVPAFPVIRSHCYEIHYVNTRFVRRKAGA